MGDNGQRSVWDPATWLCQAGDTGSSKTPFALILLNQPISSAQASLFKDLWSRASVRVCADGGGNRLLSAFRQELRSSQMSLPDAVVGDLDSLSARARNWYSQRGVAVAHRPSQYATDLQKSIQWVEDWETGQGASNPGAGLELVIFGGLSGRLDQTAHTLHVLWKLAPTLAATGGYEDPSLDAEDETRKRGGNVKKRQRSYVVGDGSLVFLLPPGQHRVNHPTPPLGEACGILPFGTEGNLGGDDSLTAGAKVSTRGLEWDVTPETPQSLGGYLSTSNHVFGDKSLSKVESSPKSLVVDIATDKPIYWSVELACSDAAEDSDWHDDGAEGGRN
ncbi:unnamed protein product [Parajaminaea phylloscopi]